MWEAADLRNQKVLFAVAYFQHIITEQLLHLSGLTVEEDKLNTLLSCNVLSSANLD